MLKFFKRKKLKEVCFNLGNMCHFDFVSPYTLVVRLYMG